MNNKKIISKTIATALATTNLATLSAQAVHAFDNNADTVNADITAENQVEVTIEETDVIGEDTNFEDSITEEEGKQDIENSLEEIVTPLEEETSVIETDETVESNELVEEIKAVESNETITEKVASKSTPKSLGKIEFDINFPMPIKANTESDISFTIFKEGTKVGTISKINDINGTFDNGASYKIEKLNSKKQPLGDGQNDFYFLHVIIEGLELGVYSAEINGEGYIDTKVDNIEIINYSKRVILGSGSKSSSSYNGVFLIGDVNGDGIIDMGDYNLVFENLGKADSNAKAVYDLNKDGYIDIADLTYVNENIGAIQGAAIVVDTDAIINPENIIITGENILLPDGGDIKEILVDTDKPIAIESANGPISEKNPLKLDFDLSSVSRNSGTIDMEQVVIKAPKVSNNENAGAPSKGWITYIDANGNEEQIPFGDNEVQIASYGIEESQARATTSENGDIVIDLGKQVAVKKISINVTENRGNKNISEIAKIEFLNNVYKEIPKPDMNRPQIKTVETCTNLHDERITLTWEPQPNVTSYEVKYEKLDENGNVTQTKKLQTNKTSLNILDKDIKPYDLYRVSIQSLNGDWESGYEAETGKPEAQGHPAFDGIADNVDADFNLIDSYYNGDKGTVSEIRVVPIQAPEKPRNLTTEQGFKSFTVSWENHPQARDFDIYYRKVGDTNKNWIKANEDRIEVTENSPEVTNPDKSKLVRSHSYVINGLEDNTAYEVRVTATNHLGTSKMSDTYIASTVTTTPPEMTGYKLINRPTDENEIGTTHIIDVRNKLDADGWASSDSALQYDSEYALVDGDFTTEWKVNDWDTGASYGADRGSEITFDDTYTIGSIGIGRTLEKGNYMGLYKVKVTYWDENGDKQVVYTESVAEKSSNGHNYYIVKLKEPITTNKIKVDTSGYGGSIQRISELKFYEYDSLADDIKDLYEDDLRLVLKDTVTQDMLDELAERLNTPDPICGEYHPEKSVLEKELDIAQKLFNDKGVSEKITILDASIRTDNEGPSLGMENSYQSLGSVARPSVDDDGTAKQITVYMGSSDPNTKVDIVFLQNYGQPGEYISKVYTISPGRTEITIPTISTADVEKGGQVMARVTQGSTTADVQIRLSGVTEIPHLNVNNLINDTSKENEVKDKIRTYISELKTYMSDIKTLYPTQVSDEDKVKNIYLYDEQTSPLNTTDIEGDRFTLTLPASEILKGIESGLEGNTEAQVERVYNALLAWEQEVQVGFAKKGVFEEVQDFNGNGTIDEEDKAYFRKHRAPLTRLNIKYQRMMMGAAAYASSHHIGVGFGSAHYIQGVPYKFDDAGNVINADEAKLYGGLIGHEMGHCMDIGDRLYPETSNNLMTAITGTMLDEDSPYASAMKDLYKKVTSNTIGLSTDRTVVVNMLWQPYLAYEDDSTYKMLFTDNDADLSNDSYYAKLNRAYREMTPEERSNGDRDQWLIRMSSKAVGKDLTDFYEAHGIVANATTLQYVAQFPKETRKIQYINDEARRRRMAGTADMAQGTTLSAEFGTDSKGNLITDGSYVNDKNVTINLSVDKSDDNILGYEIYRNGKPCGFILRDKDNKETIYTDVVDNINNRVVTYSAIAYDYNLNPTNTVELGTVKVRHDGGIAKSNTILTTNTISIDEAHNDIHSCEGNEDLRLALDDDNTTAYEGRMLSKSEYNNSVHGVEMNPNNNPYLILDTTEIKTLVGIKYTAPTTTSGFIFKKNAIADSALNKYKIEVSKDGVNWTTAKEGTLSLSVDNPTATIYFDKEGVTGGNQLNSYNARYVKITALGTKNISAAELELLTPPGDNIEIGVSKDNINYENGIGILKEKFVYVVDNPDTDENEEKSIPAGSIIITGEYRGNPAFNVPLVLNQNEEHIADNYNGILMAEVPDNGELEEIAEGTWIYWVEPQDATTFMNDNEKIFAELYRTDSADATEGGQRLVSDTFKLEVPDVLPEISLSGGNSTRTLTSKNMRAIELDEAVLNRITDKR